MIPETSIPFIKPDMDEQRESIFVGIEWLHEKINDGLDVMDMTTPELIGMAQNDLSLHDDEIFGYNFEDYHDYDEEDYIEDEDDDNAREYA